MHRAIPVETQLRKGDTSRRGYTITEVMVASSIFILGVTLSVSGYIHMLRGMRLSDKQQQLDIDVQTAIERVKVDIRLSSLDRMLFFPTGAGPFTAISFPIARDDDGDGAVDKDEDDNIIWDKTIVYHIWDTSPHQLRRTVFDPRDPSLTDAQRQEQLDSVVTTGSGAGTYNAANAQSTVVFENLFQWAITPRGAVYDGYASTQTRTAQVELGSCLLTSGPHEILFNVIGKNASSTGYRVGIDQLFVSASYSPREAEDLLPVLAQQGAMAEREYMPTGSWSGNYQLSFPAVAAGDSFKLRVENDLWRETNFQTSGDSHANTEVFFDQSIDPRDFVVALKGHGTNWTAAAQTGSLVGQSCASGVVPGAAVRVILRGEEMISGNWLNFSGEKCRVRFQSGSTEILKILAAYIGECASTTSNSMDVATGTQRPLLFAGAGAVTISGAASVWSDLLDFPIRKEKSYAVSYLVAPTPSGATVWSWPDTVSDGQPASFIITGTNNPTSTDTAAALWSTRGGIRQRSDVLGVSTLFTSYPASGAYVSSVFDTHCTAPSYNEINWDASVPGGTDISLQVRTSNAEDLSDALAWTNVPPIPTFGIIEVGNGRYAQFRAELTSDTTRTLTPKLKDVMIKWAGPARVVDISGTFTKKSNYGIFEMSIDGNPILTGVSVDLEIFDDIRGYGEVQRLTSHISAEINPRNTGM